MLNPVQKQIPYEPGPFRLRIGLARLDPADWLRVDQNMPGELAEKRRLLSERHQEVFAALPEADRGSREVLEMLVRHLLEHYPDTYDSAGSVVSNRATGESFDLAGSPLHPLELAGRLVQEDLCLMGQRPAGRDYALTAACLCFPTRWRLSEKLGLSLDEMHAPVPGYEAELSGPVNGLFDRMRVDRPVERANWSVHDQPDLHQPTGHGRAAYTNAVTSQNAGDHLWLRSERQTLRRLPDSGDILFTIRVYVRPLHTVPEDPGEAARLASALEGIGDDFRLYKSLPPIIDAAIAWLRASADR